jgi:hypothetical protein
VAQIIPFEEVARSRRRDRTRRETEECAEIIEASLKLTLEQYAGGPREDRPVRARQIRQLAELLEYVVAGREEKGSRDQGIKGSRELGIKGSR